MTARRAHAGSLALLALLVLSGCSDDGDDGSDDAGDTPATSGALDQEQLSGLLLPENSKAGPWTVKSDGFGEIKDDITLADVACQPLSALNQLDPEPTASARNRTAGEDMEDPAVEIQLLSYGDDGAAEVLAKVEKAVQECADGFVTDSMLSIIVERVEPATAPEIGDDATAYTLFTKLADDEDGLVTHVLVARRGHELAVFRATDLLGDLVGVPPEVVDAQWARLAD